MVSSLWFFFTLNPIPEASSQVRGPLVDPTFIKTFSFSLTLLQIELLHSVFKLQRLNVRERLNIRRGQMFAQPCNLPISVLVERGEGRRVTSSQGEGRERSGRGERTQVPDQVRVYLERERERDRPGPGERRESTQVRVYLGRMREREPHILGMSISFPHIFL